MKGEGSLLIGTHLIRRRENEGVKWSSYVLSWIQWRAMPTNVGKTKRDQGWDPTRRNDNRRWRNTSKITCDGHATNMPARTIRATTDLRNANHAMASVLNVPRFAQEEVHAKGEKHDG